MSKKKMPTLIYCGGGNPRFYEIATAAGFEYGAQLPDTIYGPLYFADQDWRTPVRERYMAELARHRPVMATVLDWERWEQLDEVLSWAEEAAQYVERVVIVPKVLGGINSLPRVIGGKPTVLGYSVPTQYGGTQLPAWEFAGWPVHLLGGQPHQQLSLVGYFQTISADGNYISKMATRHCQFWVSGTAYYASNRFWPTLVEADGARWENDAPYEAFRRSCENIIESWQRLY